MKKQKKTKKPVFQWRFLGYTGVDSGQLMIGDPSYFIGKHTESLKRYPKWEDFCKTHSKPDKTQMNFANKRIGLGVVAPTAFGDGKYPVFGLFKENPIVPFDSVAPYAMLVLTEDFGNVLPPLDAAFFEE